MEQDFKYCKNVIVCRHFHAMRKGDKRCHTAGKRQTRQGGNF
jgi:hypothetical protein